MGDDGRFVDRGVQSAARRKHAAKSWRLLSKFLIAAGALENDPFIEASKKVLEAGERHFALKPAKSASLEQRQRALFLKVEALFLGAETGKAPHGAPPRRLPASDVHFYSSQAWRRLRYAVLKERGARCECCGAQAADGRSINVDHIRPIATHWDQRLDRGNLQVLCSDCNRGKGSRDSTDWRATSDE